MNPISRVEGRVAVLDRPDVDTDQIIPKQFLKRIERTGYGQFAFFDWRFDEDGNERAGFELNQPQFEGARILLAGRNFGCGSSREHAPWALQDYGFDAIVAPSFADIFYNNCFKNGILPITLPEEQVSLLLERARTIPGYQVTADLEAQTVSDSQGFCAPFTVDSFRRQCLLNGLDDIGLTLEQEAHIAEHEAKRPAWKRGVGQKEERASLAG